MARKKVSEMTLIERMDRVLKEATWKEAEEVGVEILARCLAMHCYAIGNGDEYFKALMKRLCERGDEWAKEHSASIAIASVGQKLKEGKI